MCVSYFRGEVKRRLGHLMPGLSEGADSGAHLLRMAGSSCLSNRHLLFLGFGAEKHKEFHVEGTVGLLGGPGAGAWQHGKGRAQGFCVAHFHLGLQQGNFFSPCI